MNYCATNRVLSHSCDCRLQLNIIIQPMDSPSFQILPVSWLPGHVGERNWLATSTGTSRPSAPTRTMLTTSSTRESDSSSWKTSKTYVGSITILSHGKVNLNLSSQSSKPKWKKRYHMLTQQDLLVSELREIMTTISSGKEDRPKKVSSIQFSCQGFVHSVR